MQNKVREVLGEVLSDLFAKHLPREKPCKQRESEGKVRWGGVFSISPFLYVIVLLPIYE